MRYRPYGRTGRSVSEVGLGGHREGVETHGGVERNARFFWTAQERAAIVGRAIDRGVTYFDTTFGCEIASLGESLRLLGKRDGLFVSGMRVDFFALLLKDAASPREFTRREVEHRLREFGFDHIEQFILGAMEQGDPLARASIMEEVFEELAVLRAEGKINHVGFSCHDPNYAAKLLTAFPQFSAVMVPYNFANRVAEGALEDAVRHTGAAWIGMKSLVWRFYGIGLPVIRDLRPIPCRLEHDPGAPIAALAIKWMLRNERLTTCVPAANSCEAVDENTSACDGGPMTDEERATVEAYRAAGEAEEGAFLALGGLHASNGRTLEMSIGLAKKVFGLQADPIDWDQPDAEERAKATAKGFLDKLRTDPKWAACLPARTG